MQGTEISVALIIGAYITFQLDIGVTIIIGAIARSTYVEVGNIAKANIICVWARKGARQAYS